MLGLIGATDKGMVREVNEDRFAGEVFSEDFGYGVVCDGMGGENAGGVASAIACEEIRQILESSCRREMDERTAFMVLETAISTANAMVYDKAVRDKEDLGGMGTTVCAAIAVDDRLYIANVGDSRAYLLRNGELRPLTVDHTVVQMLVDRGEITPEQARTHKDRHYITRAVGVEREVRPAFCSEQLLAGDILLLCSDGLYNMVDPLHLPALLERAVKEDDGGCLLEEANRQGGADNITAVVMYRR